MARKSSEIRQESEAELNRRKDIGEECSAPRGKCIAKRRIVWGKRGANNMESRGTKHGGRIQRRRKHV